MRPARDLPDWCDGTAYAVLIGAERSAFAWEWMRRSAPYRAAWSAFCRGATLTPDPRLFGLERFEDPALRIPEARPIWSAGIIDNVLMAHVAHPAAPKSERIDLRLLARLVTICIDRDGQEHLLLSDGRHFLRIDVIVGTLIGCPASLTFLLEGLTQLDRPMLAIERLVRLVRKGRFGREAYASLERQKRWILELRAADALAVGCNQQQIARTLFGSSISAERWRIESAPYRRRVQRLTARARHNLHKPLDRWRPGDRDPRPVPAAHDQGLRGM